MLFLFNEKMKNIKKLIDDQFNKNLIIYFYRPIYFSKDSNTDCGDDIRLPKNIVMFFF